MIQFIKDAIAELEHVVWPTHVERKKYLTYVLSVIVSLALYLMVLGYIISNGLSAGRTVVQSSYPSSLGETGSGAEDTPATQADLDAILQKIHATGSTQTVSGTGAIPAHTTSSGGI